MVKTIISIILVGTMLFAGAIYEHTFVNKQFDDFHQVLTTLYDKIDNQSAVRDDVLAVQKSWLEKKKSLHVFIPHNDIKEVDLWLSEAVTLVRDKEWKDAISKIEVLLELAEQIPKTFNLSFENIL
ncbi:MAG: DUF4363 family protein [Clostridiales bacterium]|nr:DUF4363 family protein [Clostridiales bacterium]